jgi:hypothetical protein
MRNPSNTFFNPSIQSLRDYSGRSEDEKRIYKVPFVVSVFLREQKNISNHKFIS